LVGERNPQFSWCTQRDNAHDLWTTLYLRPSRLASPVENCLGWMGNRPPSSQIDEGLKFLNARLRRTDRCPFVAAHSVRRHWAAMPLPKALTCAACGCMMDNCPALNDGHLWRKGQL
jgi:hypothetical protein